jgi:hypothetical protein
MISYDRRAWAEIEKWRAKRLAECTRRVVPQGLRDRLTDVAHDAKDRFEALPGAADFEKVFLQALQGVVELGSRAAIATAPKDAIIEAYRERGHTVDDLGDIRKLELAVIDKVKPGSGWPTPPRQPSKAPAPDSLSPAARPSPPEAASSVRVQAAPPEQPSSSGRWPPTQRQCFSPPTVR